MNNSSLKGRINQMLINMSGFRDQQKHGEAAKKIERLQPAFGSQNIIAGLAHGRILPSLNLRDIS
jgi:hypothetical protein